MIKIRYLGLISLVVFLNHEDFLIFDVSNCILNTTNNIMISNMFQNVSIYGFYINNNTHYCTSALLRSTLFKYNENKNKKKKEKEKKIFNNKE